MRERDLAGRDGLFVIEGRVVLETAVQAMAGLIASVLVAEHRLGSLSDVLAGLPPDTPVYAAGQAVMDAVVGFPIHRGILALGRRAPADARALIAGLAEPALVVGLIGIANHDNMGGIFRNAGAFGVDAVLLDETCCDPLYRKAIRVSTGSALRVPFARVEGDLPALLAEAGFEVLALSPRGASDIVDINPAQRTAVLFGAEGPGLPKMVLERLQSVRINICKQQDSLNVSASAAIVLHHIAAHRRKA